MVVRSGIKPLHLGFMSNCGHVKHAVYVENHFFDLMLLHNGRPVYPHTTAVETVLHSEFAKIIIVSSKINLLNQ